MYTYTMRTIWIWVQRVVVIVLLGLVMSNALLPAVARAQMAAQPGASVVDILAALVGQTVTAERYIATASTGTAYNVSSVLSCALDTGPGANNCIGTDASGRVILAAGAGTGEVWIGESASITMTENGVLINTNGAFICRGGCVITNDFSTDPVRITDPHGMSINATTSVKGILLASVTIDVAQIDPQKCDDVTATVAGVEANDTVYITNNFDPVATEVIFTDPRVTNAATDQVTFRACNILSLIHI